MIFPNQPQQFNKQQREKRTNPMKRTIERITRAAILAVAFMLCATDQAWAVDAVAVWDGDFGVDTTRGAFTLAVPSASWVDANGNLEVQPGQTGATITIDASKGVINSCISILIEYADADSNIAAGAVPIEVSPNNIGNQFGVKKYDGSTLGISGVYQNGTVYPTSGTRVITTMPTEGALLFIMPNGSNCSVYSADTRAGLSASGKGGEIAGLKFTSATLTQVGLGGSLNSSHQWVTNFVGLTIKKVAIFNSAITASDAASYKFPAESDYMATITAANTQWGDIVWDNDATWDDSADNSSKTVALKFANGASVVRDGGLSAARVDVSGSGSLCFTDTAGTGATVSSALSGEAGIVARSGTITFSGANTFTGGLTVKSGAIAKSGDTSGFGVKNSTITVENGGAVDIANTGSYTYKFVIEGSGVDNSGALYSSSAIGGGAKQAQSITLTGNATITVGANWGIINDGYALAKLDLGSYTLTKKGNGRFWLCNTTISGTGTLAVEGGYLNTISSSYTSTGADATIRIGSGATLFVGGDTDLDGLNYTYGDLSIKNLEVQLGASVTVASERTLTVTSSLTSNGTISDSGTIVCSGTITGTDKSITIASGALFKWNNQAWSSGDYFTGQGTLELNVNSGLKEMSAPNTFSGVLKLTSPRNDLNYPVIGASTGDAESIFTGMPELVLNGYMGLQDSFAGKSLSVRNISDSSSSDRIRMNKFSAAGNKTIKTKQTKNTTVSGIFQYNGSKYSALTVYGDDNATEIYSLTLSGANETPGPLTIQNKAKVVLASGGKWAGPTTVENGGYLEVQHTTSPLAALTLNGGATIVVPSSGTPLTASGAITYSGEGTIYVDLTNAGIEDGAGAVTIITGASLANITVDNVASIFQETSGDYTFSVDGNSIKATNIGTCTWSGSSWDKDDPSIYNEVVVNVVEGGTTLALDAIYSFRKVTLSGSSGTLTISGAGTISADTLIIPTGVTLDASSRISASSISGGGTLNIPAGVTYSMDGVDCSVKITCAGTLETSGTTSLGSTATTISGLLDVLSGETTLYTAECGINGGTITIEPAAKLIAKSHDAPNYYGSSTINVYGTLQIDELWSLEDSNNIYLYNGCTVTGGGNGTAAFDLCGGAIYVKSDKGGGTGTVTFGVKTRLCGTQPVSVDEDMTFVMNGEIASNSSWGTGHGFTKTGNGTFELSPSSIAAFTGTVTVSAGRMIMPSSPSFGTVSIADGAVFTLRSDLNGSSTYTGTGMLEMENTGGDKWYLQNTDFSGIIKTKNSGGNYWIGGANANGGLPPLFSGKPELIAESGTQLLNRNFNNSTLPVRDLSGNATFSVGNIGTSDATDADVTRTISTKQTKPTTFGGVFSSYDNTKTALKVYGEDEATDVYSLTLTGVNNTTGLLTITNNAKVVFSSTGSWANGSVAVCEDGWLQSTNSAAIKNLTLGDGSHIVFPTSSSALTGITNLTFASGTTYISFPDGAPDSGTIIDWTDFGSAPAGTFILEGSAAETHILTKGATGLTIAKGAASFTATNGTVTPYETLVAAYAAIDAAYGSYQYITLLSDNAEFKPEEGVKYKIADGVTITLVAKSSEYGVPTPADNGSGVITYTYPNNATTYTWSGEDTFPTKLWSRPDNWTYNNGASGATRQISAVDSTIINLNTTESPIIVGDVTVHDISIGNTVKMTASSAKTLTVTDGVVLTSADATLEIAGSLSLEATVTTSVADKCVKWVNDGSSITYSVVDPVAQIGEVEYGSLANAFEMASTTVTNTVTLLANCSETAVTLDGKTVSFDEGSYSFTGSLTGNGTVIVSDATKGAAWRSARFASEWTGEFVCDWTHSDASFHNSYYGSANSTVTLTSMTAGYFQYDDSYSGKVKIAGGVTTSNGWGDNAGSEFAWNNTTTFNQLELASGGSLNLVWNTGAHGVGFKILTLYPRGGSITLADGGKTHLKIGTVNLTAEPAVNTRIVQITPQSSHVYNNANPPVENGLIDVTVTDNGVTTASTKKLFFDTDGLYVVAAQIGDTPYKTVAEAVMAMAASGGRDQVVEVLDSGYEGTSDYEAFPSLIFWNDETRTYSYAEAQIGTTGYATLVAALSTAASGADKTVKLYKDVTASPVLPAGVSLNLNGYTLTGTVTAATGYVPSKRIVDGKVVYTADPDTTGEEWTDGSGDHAWNNANNWSLGFVPVANTPVTFPAGFYSVSLATHDGSEKCGSMTVTGDVTLQRANSDTWAYVQINGDVSGAGTLTLVHVGLGSLANRTISCPVVVDGTDGKDALCNSSGKTFTFTNTVTISGEFKANESPITFTGCVTFNDGGYVYACGNYYRVDVVFNGGIVVSANSGSSLTKTSAGYHTIASAVTLNSGATLTIPDGTTASGATFAAWSPLYNVVSAAGDGSTKVYSVEKKPGTIFSVY